MPNIDIPAYDCATDILIDDKEIVSPAESHENPFEQWKLANWIENMKVWPGLPEELGLKKYGARKLAEYKNAQDQRIATHMEYHLLHKRELESRIYSEPLLRCIPQVNLMLASHDYITRRFWPVLGYLWKPLCSDADFLWGLFEYSLCYKSFYDRLESGRESKKAFQAKLGNAIKTKLAWLEDPWVPQKTLKSSMVDHLVTQTARNASGSHWDEFLKEFKLDPFRHLYKLVFIESEQHILYEKQSNTLIEPYQDYAVRAWNRFLEQVNLSENYGFWHLQSLDYEPMWSEKVGRPPRQKGFISKTKSQSRRGPAIGSKRKAM